MFFPVLLSLHLKLENRQMVFDDLNGMKFSGADIYHLIYNTNNDLIVF